MEVHGVSLFELASIKYHWDVDSRFASIIINITISTNNLPISTKPPNRSINY